MGITLGLRKKEKPAEVAAPPATERAESPPLYLLIPDAGGIAAYQSHDFPRARSAEFFLDSTLRGQIPEGTILFWALTDKPEEESAEPLVLIRDPRRIIYPFSFSTIESAYLLLAIDLP